MESVNEIKEALSARSRTATLDELRSEGRKRVRLIRAEHVAQMISEAVHAAIEHSGLLEQEEVDRLVEKSRQEFKSILREREAELARSRETEDQLEAKDAELAGLRASHDALNESLDAARAELQQAQGELDGLAGQHRQELEALRSERKQLDARSRRAEEQLEAAQTELAELRARFGELNRTLAATRAELQQVQSELEVAREAAQAPAAAMAAPAPQSDMLLALVQEMSTLKANLMQAQGQAQAPQAAAAAPAADFSAAIEKLAGSLNDRLETLGRKMGVSSAVGGDAPMDFGGLFDAGESKLESNMDNITVKQKAGGGIAANLARLKKLKGGG